MIGTHYLIKTQNNHITILINMYTEFIVDFSNLTS